jgi:hypothetical protein
LLVYAIPRSVIREVVLRRSRPCKRQAATAKSEEGASEVSGQDAGVDAADKPLGPPGTAMTRHEHPMTRRGPAHPTASMTALRSADQPSAWSRDLLWGGGIGFGALIIALGYATVRPTPRRRRPAVPAPARAPHGRRGPG